MGIKKENFGKTQNGTMIQLFTLRNQNEMEVKISNFGAAITSILVKDSEGQKGEVVLGFENLEGYLGDHPFFGVMVGRYANRIAKAKFSIDGIEYKLTSNEGENQLHGGKVGFDKVVWDAEELFEKNAVRLTYKSKDGEEGYPGNLNISVVYTLTELNEIKIDVEAITDKATHVNITNHSYFNLSAGKSENVLDHIITINADHYTEVNEQLLPTGQLLPLSGSPLDFKTLHAIGERVSQLRIKGYDHNFVLNNYDGGLQKAATAYDPGSGRYMEVFTTQPGVQLYTANTLDFPNGRNGVTYKNYGGFCLETQHFPDTPNHSHFPSTLLRPGEKYEQSIIYKFSVK